MAQGNWPPAGTPLIRISDVTVIEGNTGSVNATFDVTLSVASDQPVTVHYATADDSATVGSDYVATSGELTFAAGQTSQSITVAVLGDRLPEPTERFFVHLSAPTHAIIADGLGVGTIIDDEPYLSMEYYSDIAVAEGDSGTTPMVFTVVLSAAGEHVSSQQVVGGAGHRRGAVDAGPNL